MADKTKSKYRCEYCGEIVLQDPRLTRRPERIFCSQTCRKMQCTQNRARWEKDNHEKRKEAQTKYYQKMQENKKKLREETIAERVVVEENEPLLPCTCEVIKLKWFNKVKPYSALNAEHSWERILSCRDPITHRYISPPPKPQKELKNANP